MAENKPANKGVPETSEKPAEGVTAAEIAPPSRISRLFNAILKVVFVGTLGLIAALSVALLFMLDFLDVVQWRYKIPERYRESTPLKQYYDFVKRHQMPDEERFRLALREEQENTRRLLLEGTDALQSKAREQSQKFDELVKFQQEKYRQDQQKIATLQEETVRERQRVEALARDLEARKAGIDLLSQQIASEAAQIEASLIQFMENEKRLEPLQQIASMMDPLALAQVFNETSDNKLIYDVLQGMPPETAARVLAGMDAEKASKIVRIAKEPPTLPRPGSRPYIPPTLANLVASSQANLRP